MCILPIVRPGRQKYIALTSNLGFHAPRLRPGGTPQDLNVVLAMIGFYVRDIGYNNLDLLVWIIEKTGNDVNWLRRAEIQRFDIEVIARNALPNVGSLPPPPPPPPIPGGTSDPKTEMSQCGLCPPGTFIPPPFISVRSPGH